MTAIDRLEQFFAGSFGPRTFASSSGEIALTYSGFAEYCESLADGHRTIRLGHVLGFWKLGTAAAQARCSGQSPLKKEALQ
jgi:hypothetical protein